MNAADLYYSTAMHLHNNREFIRVMAEFPEFQYWQPAPRTDPWLWKAKKGDVTLDIWPHVAKARYTGAIHANLDVERKSNPTKQGWGSIRATLRAPAPVRAAPDGPSDFQLIED
jgi:hypothetical protein